MTNTSVVLPVIPSWELPEVPYPCEGGMTARMRLPTFLPISADSRPGSIVPPITVGLLVKVLALSEELLPCQEDRTKLAARAPLLVSVVPLPWMRVLTVRLLPGVAFGMVTLGVLSNAPDAVTAVFAPGEPAAEEVAEDDEEAVDFDDPPQAARTRQASKGTAMSARKRRMKNLNSGRCQPRQPTGLTGGTIPPRPPCSWGDPSPQTPLGGASPPTCRYMPAISFSTRSST